ncbi:MAG: hypothetical protein ACYDBT_02475 [Desulfobulbaceae bacterium]
MQLIADAHVHVYPCHDPRTALDTLRRNLAGLDGRALAMAFLAERYDCNFFAGLGRLAEALPGAPLAVEYRDEALILREEGFPELFLFAGRQVITRERVEILALTTDAMIPDGLAEEETVARIGERGGVPVLSWAPGKWFFSRRRVVEGLLDRFAPGTLLVGDTSLRPRGWLMPLLMRRALQQGFGLVAGSDPLPFRGEEAVLGSYAIRMDAEFDPADPVGSARAILTRPGFCPRRVGRRGGLLPTLRRLAKNSRARKEAGSQV